MAVDVVIVETFNDLLRLEQAAVACYQQVLEKLAANPAAGLLDGILRAHERAATSWREQVYAFGGRPTAEAGAWAAFAPGMGGPLAYQSLREAEDYTARSYQDALQATDLPAESTMLIRGTLLPQTQEHIRTLDQLMEGTP